MKGIILAIMSIFLLSFTMPFGFSYKKLYTINKIRVSGKKITDIQPILVSTLNQTTSELSFNLKSRTSEMYKTKKANCVGYTIFFNNLLKKNLKNNGVGNVEISHIRAKVHYMKMNLHVFDSKLLKDHDISVIKNLNTGETYYVDASLSEVFGDIIIKQ